MHQVETPQTSTLSPSQHAKLEKLSAREPEPRVVALAHDKRGQEMPVVEIGPDRFTINRRGALIRS